MTDLEKSGQQTGGEGSGYEYFGVWSVLASVSQTCKEITFTNTQSENNLSFVIRAAVERKMYVDLKLKCLKNMLSCYFPVCVAQ